MIPSDSVCTRCVICFYLLSLRFQSFLPLMKIPTLIAWYFIQKKFFLDAIPKSLNFLYLLIELDEIKVAFFQFIYFFLEKIAIQCSRKDFARCSFQPRLALLRNRTSIHCLLACKEGKIQKPQKMICKWSRVFFFFYRCDAARDKGSLFP